MLGELEEDNQKKLTVLLSSLDQLRHATTESSRVTNKMVGILTHFDERLAKLEGTIQPIYKETGILQSKQEASNQALTKLEYIIRFYTVSGEVEQFIQQGLSPSTLEAYLSALNELSRADEYFRKNNPQSPELLNVQTLLQRGGNNVENEFRLLLQQHCNTIPPKTILNLIGQQQTEKEKATAAEQESGTTEETKDSVKKTQHKFANVEEISLSEKRRQQLRTLSTWLTKNRPKEFVTLYANLRSEVLFKSLGNLWEHLRSTSLTTVLTENPRLSLVIGPLLGGADRLDPNKVDPPSQRKRQNRLSTADAPALSAGGGALIKKLPNLGGVVRPSASMADIKDVMAGEAVTEREIVTYVIAVTGLFKLMQLEYHFISQSIESEHFREAVFSRVVVSSLDRIRGEGEALCARVKKCVHSKDYSTVLCLLPVYRFHTHMRHSFDMLLDGCEDEVQKKLHTLGVTLQTTISKSLEEYIEFIRNDLTQRVPKDGTVHELTSNMMLFLENLQAYMDILSRVIIISDFKFLEEYTKLGWNKNQLTFAHHIVRTLGILGLALMRKSDAYTDPTLQAVFRMNNIHYIVKSLYKTKLMDLAKLAQHEIEAHYDDRMRTYKHDYLCVWNRLKALLYEGQNPAVAISQQKTIMSPQYQPQHHQTLPTTSYSNYSLSSAEKSEFKLKDKQRQAIKDKFNAFNKEFEVICQAHSAYVVPDADLRRDLTRVNCDTILPPYSLFYNKYVKLDFTKNVHKYLKYSPEHVAQMVQGFFGQKN